MLSEFILAKISGLNLTFMELVNYKKEKINIEMLLKAMIFSKKANLNISKDKIVELIKRNYNIMNIVKMLLLSKNLNIYFPFDEILRGDKIGIDYEKELIGVDNKEEKVKEIKNKIYSNS